MSIFAEFSDVMFPMGPDQVVSVCQKYSEILNGLGAKPFRDRDVLSREGKLNHLRFMCDHIIVETQSATIAADVEKAMRWFGFVQGAMYALELRTIDAMREDNR